MNKRHLVESAEDTLQLGRIVDNPRKCWEPVKLSISPPEKPPHQLTAKQRGRRIYNSAMRYIKALSTIAAFPPALFTAYALSQAKISIYLEKELFGDNKILVYVKNEGHFSVYNVKIDCLFAKEHIDDGHDLKELATGTAKATFCSSDDYVNNKEIIVTVTYNWFYGLIESSKKEGFTVFKSTKNNVYLFVPFMGVHKGAPQFPAQP